jgi:hypothetical protein
MKAQMLANRGTADPRAQQQRGRLDRPARDPTVPARTVRAVVEPSARVTVTPTPAARPSAARIRSARAPTTNRAPASAASRRNVFIVESLQPRWHPAKQ